MKVNIYTMLKNNTKLTAEELEQWYLHPDSIVQQMTQVVEDNNLGNEAEF